MRALALLLVLVACAPAAPVPKVVPASGEAAEPKRPPEPRIARFVIGALPAFALKDGDLHEKNDAQTFGLGHAPAEIDALLGAPSPTLDLSIQPLLVRDGERVLLFDTGALRPPWAPGAGALLASLALTGIAPGAVTDIFLSHHHDDHVGGLLDPKGALAFPKARIHLTAPEWKAMQATKDQADVVAAITPQVVPFQPGAELLASVRAVPVDGHTPGHSAYEIHSGAARLLYLGDATHHSVISVRRPGWPVDYDEDKALAAASREALLARVATEQLRVYGVHFPFPGLGTITRTQAGFAFVADNEPRDLR